MGRKSTDDLPNILYNYSSLENKAIQNDILNNITNNILYFSNPIKAFNDPFDCRLEFNWSGTVGQWMKRFRRIAKSNEHFKMSNNELRVLTKQHIEDMKDTDNRKTFLETVMMDVGMVCLSGLKDDILMFSHYSAKHEGFSLGFDIRNCIDELNSDYILSFRSINYIDKPKIPNFLKISFEELYDYNLYTKSKKWEHEDEWRITNPSRWGNHNYPEKMLKEIVLGCQITNENRDLIVNANAKRKYPAKIFATKKIIKKFGAKRIEIK